jgi:hypothetical protein
MNSDAFVDLADRPKGCQASPAETAQEILTLTQAEANDALTGWRAAIPCYWTLAASLGEGR